MTTVFPGPRRSATWRAALAAAPEEPPTKSPSSRASAAQVAKAGASGTVMISSMRLRSRIGQICERPMPSTSWGPIVSAAEDRALRLDGDAQQVRLTLRQIARDADEGARRSDAGDPRVDPTADLLGDLGSGRFVVGLGVDGILRTGREGRSRESKRRSRRRGRPLRTFEPRRASARPRRPRPSSASP